MNTSYNKCFDYRDNVQKTIYEKLECEGLRQIIVFFSEIMETIAISPKYIINVPTQFSALELQMIPFSTQFAKFST